MPIDPMRVVHVITRLIVGGAQENTLATVLGLRSIEGFDVRLISGPTHGPEGSLEPLVPPEILTVVPSLVRPVHPVKDLAALCHLTRLFRVLHPDIVHTHSGKAGILGRLAARQAGVPVIIHTIHGPSFGAFQGAVSNAIFRSAEQLAGRGTTHFITVADAMRDQYLAAGIGRPEQYTRVFSGFPLEPYHAARNNPALRARLGIAPQDFVIGKIARLFKLKGHDDLIAAAPAILSQCPQARFLLIGDGIWRKRFEDQIRSMGLESRFTFTGLIAPEEIPAHIGIMDMLAHLSRREGLPRALPQALAAARPVVACDCDGAREVCIDNQTGFLIAPGNSEALVRRILQLASNTSLRERLGKTGQEFVRRNFSVEQMVAGTHSVYSTCGFPISQR